MISGKASKSLSKVAKVSECEMALQTQLDWFKKTEKYFLISGFRKRNKKYKINEQSKQKSICY